MLENPWNVIGFDEAGRGCLAGPVVAAAAWLPEDVTCRLAIQDSKKLSEARRELLFEPILSEFRVGIGFATSIEVDEINVLQASFLAMRRALEQLETKVGSWKGWLASRPRPQLWVDGHLSIPKLQHWEQTPVVGGDRKILQIAAASIVAKVTRDRWMKEIAQKYPEYLFEEHKGYPTPIHKERIRMYGACAIHRKTFRGVIADQTENTEIRKNRPPPMDGALG